MQHLAKNMIPSDIELVRGYGTKVHDSNGKEYLDLTCQTLNLNLGHGHPAIVNAIRNLMNSDGFPYYISPRYKNKYVERLAERLTELAPEGLNKVNLHLCNGSDANEDGLKRARKYHQGRKKMIVSFNGSYLGTSSEVISASGGNFWKEPCLGGSGDYLFIDPFRSNKRPIGMTLEEHANDKVKEFENLVKSRGDIAGIIMELVPFNGGILVPPKEYIKGLERVCNENDVVMIVDEVQTAFGWCGDIFASNIYGVQPDVIAMGKGMTAGFPALAATVFKEKYDILHGGTSENTFGAQTLGCVAALANIDYLISSGIMNEVPKKHDRFMMHLRKMKEKYPFVGDVRGLGLILGIEFVREDGTPDMDKNIDVYHAAFDRGLMINVSTGEKGRQNVISIKPPVTISLEEIDDAMERLDEAMRSCLN